MIELTTTGWKDYELLDSGNGMRLERFGQFRLRRPDPQAIWLPSLSRSEWDKHDAAFEETRNGKEFWMPKRKMPESWQMKYNDLTFLARLSPFKHTGVFPEQHLQWDWITEQMKKAARPLNILNLFAYTGLASLVAASCGAKVTHVDASKPTIAWARENQHLSGLEDKPIRWILDDALKFVLREGRRGVKYDGIIMDPPVYGHGPGGEKWSFNVSFPQLMEACTQILSDKPVFVLINAYAISSSSIMLGNVLSSYMKKHQGTIEYGELALQESNPSKRLLSTGIFSRWSA